MVYNLNAWSISIKWMLSLNSLEAIAEDPAVAYTVLNGLDLPQLTDVLLQVGLNNLNILTGYQSPPHVNGVRTELYVKATRLVVMPSGTVTNQDILQVIDHFGILDRPQQAALVKFMRQNAELDKILNAIYGTKTNHQTNTELHGLIVGNFDYSFAMKLQHPIVNIPSKRYDAIVKTYFKHK